MENKPFPKNPFTRLFLRMVLIDMAGFAGGLWFLMRDNLEPPGLYIGAGMILAASFANVFLLLLGRRKTICPQCSRELYRHKTEAVFPCEICGVRWVIAA